MGIAASQARLIMIARYQSDLEFSLQMITQKRTILAFQSQQAAEAYPELAEQYHTMDKELERQSLTLQTQQKMVNAEYDSLKKTLDDNITRQMKYNS